MGRIEIVTLTVGARAKEGKGEGEGRKKILFSLPAPSLLPLTRPISSSLREVSKWCFREQIAHSKKMPALQAKQKQTCERLTRGGGAISSYNKRSKFQGSSYIYDREGPVALSLVPIILRG